MTIEKIEDLRKEIEERARNREGIRSLINGYCKTHYGIADFYSTAGEFFKRQQGFEICLSRQIPTASIQHLAKHLFAEWLALRGGIPAKPIALAFGADSFLFSNALKKSYVDVPLYSRGRISNRKIVVGKDRAELDGKILNRICAVTGKTLPVFHQGWREQILGNDRTEIDLSDFFLKCLQQCLDCDTAEEKPDYVFVESSGDKEKTIATKLLGGQKILRPPAEWYYPIYLMLFVDSSRALLSADKHSPKSDSLYEEAIGIIKRVTGFSPLIIHIPKEIKIGYTSNLLELPEWVLRDKNWKNKIGMPSNDSTLFEAYEYFARRLFKEGNK